MALRARRPKQRQCLAPRAPRGTESDARGRQQHSATCGPRSHRDQPAQRPNQPGGPAANRAFSLLIYRISGGIISVRGTDQRKWRLNPGIGCPPFSCVGWSFLQCAFSSLTRSSISICKVNFLAGWSGRIRYVSSPIVCTVSYLIIR